MASRRVSVVFAFLLFICPCLFAFYGNTKRSGVVKNSYEEGLIALQSGHWQEALKIWNAGLSNERTERTSSPAMAFKFMETVTAHRYYPDYASACRYYLDAFRNASWKNQPRVLKKEIEKILPIVPGKLKKMWEAQIKRHDPGLFKEVVIFWDQEDPIFSTYVNERLVEHYERIAYAKEHFTRTHLTVYGTDDRGLIYVKYGAPEKQVDNKVLFHSTTNPLTGLPVMIGDHNSLVEPRIPLIFHVILWEYQFSNSTHPSYYLFGRDKNTGPFGLQPGILNMIPSYGYVLPAAGLGRAGGSFLIKYGMLQELNGTTGYFDTIYQRITKDLILRSEGNFDASVFEDPALLYKYENQEKIEARMRDLRSPPSTTSLITTRRIMPVGVHFYRLLNGKGKPEYIISSIPDIGKFRKMIEKSSKKSDLPIKLILSSTVITYNQDGVRTIKYAKPLKLKKPILTHPVMMSFPGENLAIPVFYGMDLWDESKVDTLSENNKDAILIGSSGPLRFAMPNSIMTEQGKMTASDIFIGRSQPIDDHNIIPFIPVADPVFHRNENVLVYFEVYNLPGPDYSVEYRFDRYVGNVENGRRKPYKEKAAVTIQYQDAQTTDKRWFEVKLDHFRPGWYDMVMVVKNKGNSQTVVRRMRIRISRK